MTEHIGKSPDGDFHVIFQWKDHWYCLPFFVIEEVANERKKIHPPPHKLYGLIWYCHRQWEPEEWILFKEIMEPEMPGMEAYRLYDEQ